MLDLNNCQSLQHLELGGCRDPSTDSKEGDVQDGMGAKAEEGRLGTPPVAQGLAVHTFAWLKTWGRTEELWEQTLSPCVQLGSGGQLPPSQ